MVRSLPLSLSAPISRKPGFVTKGIAQASSLDNLLTALPAGLELLADEEGDEGDEDDEDDAEDDDDAGLLGSPVAALGEVDEGVASDDGRGVDGRHFGGEIKRLLLAGRVD